MIPCNEACEAEQREAELPPLDTTKDNWYNPGAASSSECPRKGSILLERRRGGGVTIVRTTCNSWRCLGCRDRNINRFKAMVTTGASTLGRCAFITITYKAGAARLRDAECVAKDWRALWRQLHRYQPWTKKLQWVRVMEMTKRGTPHFHLIAGPIDEPRRINCWGSSLEIRRYNERFASCQCVAHSFARSWRRVQRDESYLVHAIPVRGSGRACGSYMAKYMSKAFPWPGAAGMQRKYSKSRGWPSEPRARLQGTLEGDGWRRRLWQEGGVRDWGELEKTLSKHAGERRLTEKQEERERKAWLGRFIKLGRSLNGNETNS